MPRFSALRIISNPAQFVLVAFALLIALGTVLLALPLSADSAAGIGLEDSVFLSTSATTVTGLSTVDVADLSLFGELVLLALVQVGGFGIMTIGSVLALVTFRHIGLRQRMLARAEIGAVDFGELSRLLGVIARLTLLVEASLALMLFARLWQGGYEDGPVDAAYSAVFHAITTFNNAGISLYSDNLAGFVGDPFVAVPVSVGFVLGGLGFPIYVEALRRWQHARSLRAATSASASASVSASMSERRLDRARPWSLHARLTVGATLALVVVGPVMVLALEWRNPATLGPMSIDDKLLNGWFHGVTPRTSGFNTVDIGSMSESTLFATSVLMFIGAGPASTSGGIKVTTAAILAAAIWAEVRGERDVSVLRRRIPPAIIRQALTIVVLSLAFVTATSLFLMTSDGLGLTAALFESTSAFGTVGLSTGVTGSISTLGHVVLVVVMLCGRVGPITFVTAIALRERARLYRHPEETPIIG